MNRSPVTRHALTALTVSLIAACARSPREASPEQAATSTASTTSTTADTTSGWRPLVGGSSLDAWRGYKAESVPEGWTVADGVLSKTKGIGDLVTRDQFGDFELEFDWKLASGGNAGVFYRGTEEYDHIYWSAPEYQLLDDAHAADGRNRLTSAGAAYGLYPAPAGVVRPAGEWNSSRIVVRGAHVEHWLNGQKIVEYELASPDWEAKVKASKFGSWPNYGRAQRGHIGIQGDHSGDLSIRNMRIRELR